MDPLPLKEPMPRTAPLPYSVLDLSPILPGSTAADSFRATVDLAQHAERWGYRRFWLAEHHNIPGIASAATSVLIGHVAGKTERIRVGAGGIMLPNHAPLVIAEQFGTLESLYPGRIDLGLGRAPGGDAATVRALRRTLAGADSFPHDVLELQGYFRKAEPGQRVRAIPGEGLGVPLYLLGSSLFSAGLAAELGLPFAFASHFAPDHLLAALEVYRTNFRPSDVLDEPHAIVGANVVAADTDDEARLLFTSIQRMFLNLVRGQRTELTPPADAVDWTAPERAHVERMLACSAVGSRATVRDQLGALVERTDADEVIVTAQIFDHGARLRSFELAAAAFDELNARSAVP